MSVYADMLWFGGASFHGDSVRAKRSGGVISVAVTVAVHVSSLPTSSFAVRVTIVAPLEKKLGASCLISDVVSTLSVAVALVASARRSGHKVSDL